MLDRSKEANIRRFFYRRLHTTRRSEHFVYCEFRLLEIVSASVTYKHDKPIIKGRDDPLNCNPLHVNNKISVYALILAK